MSRYFQIKLVSIQEKLYSIKIVPIPTPLICAMIQFYSTYCMNHGLFHSPNSHVIAWMLKLLCASRHHATDVYKRCRPKPSRIPALRNWSNCVTKHTCSLQISPEKRNFPLRHGWRQGVLELGPPTPPSTPAPYNDTVPICIASSYRGCHVSRCDSGAIPVLQCCNNGIILRYDKT